MADNRRSRTKVRWIRRIMIAVLAIFLTSFALRMYEKHRYPYGRSHSCDKILLALLLNYADANDGGFPTGESSPEASLSLLARTPYGADSEILRGKTIPTEVVEGILARGELLGPQTCGWHYVEGLRSDDDSRIAIFWDKVGLGHNGEQMANGDRKITRIGFANETIPGSEWEVFLKEQKGLLEKLPEHRRRLALQNFPP